MNKINSVKEIKKIIDEVVLPGYSYKTNFNCPEFLIDINNSLIIAAKLVRYSDRVVYKFILDTQFSSSNEITHDEIKMINNIINILEDNRKFVLSKFKKYTVNEYDNEMEYRKQQSEKMINALMKMIGDNKITIK